MNIGNSNTSPTAPGFHLPVYAQPVVQPISLTHHRGIASTWYVHYLIFKAFMAGWPISWWHQLSWVTAIEKCFIEYMPFLSDIWSIIYEPFWVWPLHVLTIFGCPPQSYPPPPLVIISDRSLIRWYVVYYVFIVSDTYPYLNISC